MAMFSSVLDSPRAIAVNNEIMHNEVMRAFVRMREFIAANEELAKKLDALERKVGSHDQAIAGILAHIRQLMAPPDTNSSRSASSRPKRSSC
ncbi:MAG: hypothetical protein ACKVQU_36955 [Burkholderiales bacterium]